MECYYERVKHTKAFVTLADMPSAVLDELAFVARRHHIDLDMVEKREFDYLVGDMGAKRCASVNAKRTVYCKFLGGRMYEPAP
jgi:hypothetical protein